jgi:membrane-associated phospholipid phosphatase
LISQVIATVRKRLSAAGYFGAQLLAGGLVLVGAGWVFGGIAEGVVDGEPLTALDARLAAWFHAHAIEPVTQLMLGVSAMNGTLGISILSVLLALFFAWKRDWYWLLGLALAVPGGMLLNLLTKFAFHRQRPVFIDPIVTLSSYSFPSGHALASTVFYGTLAAYLVPRVKTAGWRAALLVGTFLMVMLVGLSRIYLGVHFLSDVVGAIAEGLAWLGLCMVTVASLRRRQATSARTP